MTTATATGPRKARPPTDADSRAILFHGEHINGAELGRINAARNAAYLSRTGSPHDPALDMAMAAAGLRELAAIVAERDAELDRRADESAMCDRIEAGYCC